MRPEFITVGTVVNAHGIRGEVKVNPTGADASLIAGCKTLYIGGEVTAVRSARVHKSVVLLTLPGVEDMDTALALKGKDVALRRADVTLPEGIYFDAELEGLAVLDDDTGAAMGTLRRVLHYPAHDVYEVRGEKEYLIPAVPGVFVAAVDLDGGVMRVHAMKGLSSDED